MIANRSVPVDTVLPHIFYDDLDAAINWLTRTFGFREHYRYGDPVSGAQLHLGNAWIMVVGLQRERGTPAQLGFTTQSLTIFTDDVKTHFERSKSAGVTIVEELHETVYGELQYGAEDLAGHRWLFSRHAHDLSPDQWGAIVAEPVTLPPRIAPMLAVSDGGAAIEFYRKAFGATLDWQLGSAKDTIAGLSIHGVQFFLAPESPDFGTNGPKAAGFTTVRIELFVDDPVAVQRQAVAAGATERNAITEYHHVTTGPRPIGRMLQGSVLDPFGHMWLIGKFLE